MKKRYDVYTTTPGARVEYPIYHAHASNIEDVVRMIEWALGGRVVNSIQVLQYPPLPLTEGCTVRMAGSDLWWVMHNNRLEARYG